MPLTNKGNKILAAMKARYGDKKGKEVFYASENAGKLKGATKNYSKADKVRLAMKARAGGGK